MVQVGDDTDTQMARKFYSIGAASGGACLRSKNGKTFLLSFGLA
jgi:hypothetical protein